MMKNDMELNEYTSIVLKEARQQLDCRDTTTDLFARLGNVADILKLLTAYKTTGVNIKTFLDNNPVSTYRHELEEYAETLRLTLQRDISSLTAVEFDGG